MTPIRPAPLDLISDHYDRLTELREDHALVLRRIYLERKTITEVGRELRIDSSGVRSREQTALKRLRERVFPDEASSFGLVTKHQNRLSELGKQQAHLLRERYVKRKTLQQVANKLGRPISSVFNLQRSALERFRKIVAPDQADPFQLVWKNKDHLGILKKSHAAVLRWRFIERKSRREVASRLDLVASSVGHREKSALNNLRILVNSTDPPPVYLVKANRALIDQLQEHHAFILQRRFLENRTQKEIAKELRITKTCASSRTQTAIAKLRHLVSARQLSPASSSIPPEN
ncbi:MAG: hypothetical protein KCHDKBKB_01023 [Elusimicrobia bacterium]|nr:hypothetical protein [Elusimicrobiota bacterium]